MIVESVTFELVRFIQRQLYKQQACYYFPNSQLNAEEEICIDILELTVHHLLIDT